MLLHNAPLFSIYFGNADDKLFPPEYLNIPGETFLLEHEPFSKLKKMMHLKHLIFLRQTHQASGIIITQELADIPSFSREGDFLITALPKIGIGVMTGDCLPIIFYDYTNNVVAIAHAGWRGSVEGIAVKTVMHMQQKFGTKLGHLKIFFGPSAKVCCYEVDNDFARNLESYSYASQVMQHHKQKLFFDLPGFNRMQLEVIGIKKKIFHLDYNICTICNDKYYSYRRQKEDAGRQMTVVCLK